MSITRAPLRQEQPFTVFANELLNDESLNVEALGLLTYLLSKPANWNVMPGPLGKRFGCGRDKVYRILLDLIKAGYATRDPERDSTGVIRGWNYLVSNEKNPLPENPEVGEEPLPENTTSGKSAPQKKDSTTKERLDSHSVKRGDQPYSDDFETLWQQYPRTRNTSKKDAWNFYRVMTDDKQEMVRRAVPQFAAAMRAEGRTDDKILHMIRFLRNGVYETVAPPPTAGATAAGTKPFWEIATRKQWGDALLLWSMNWNWNRSWGPEPENPMRPNPVGSPKHHVPQDILDRFDLKYRGHLYSPEQKQEIQDRVEAASKHAVDRNGAACDTLATEQPHTSR